VICFTYSFSNLTFNFQSRIILKIGISISEKLKYYTKIVQIFIYKSNSIALSNKVRLGWHVHERFYEESEQE